MYKVAGQQMAEFLTNTRKEEEEEDS